MRSKLQLDFISHPAFSISNWSLSGLILLILSFFILIFTWQAYEASAQEQSELSFKVNKFNRLFAHKKVAVPVVDSKVSPEKMLQIQTTIGALIVPWNGLLQDIEKADMQDIALLNLDPNVKKQQVIISGEAKNLQTVLSYIQKLEAQPMLNKVYLQKYTVDEANQFKPVKFTLLAQWAL